MHEADILASLHLADSSLDKGGQFSCRQGVSCPCRLTDSVYVAAATAGRWVTRTSPEAETTRGGTARKPATVRVHRVPFTVHLS